VTLEITYIPQALNIDFAPASMGIEIENPITRDYVERDPYTGEYTFTPSAETQTVPTNGLRMTDDITINPIPNNYGLITWNGSVITVS